MTARFRALSASDLARLGADPAALSHLPDGPTLRLDRTWHALHFLLCNDPWDGPAPLDQAILGGAALLADDLGPRLLNAELVARVAHALFPINIPAVIADFHPGEFDRRDIYPGPWHPSTDWLPLLARDLTALREFFLARAAAGDAVLIHIATNA